MIHPTLATIEREAALFCSRPCPSRQPSGSQTWITHPTQRLSQTAHVMQMAVKASLPSPLQRSTPSHFAPATIARTKTGFGDHILIMNQYYFKTSPSRLVVYRPIRAGVEGGGLSAAAAMAPIDPNKLKVWVPGCTPHGPISSCPHETPPNLVLGEITSPSYNSLFARPCHLVRDPPPPSAGRVGRAEYIHGAA